MDLARKIALRRDALQRRILCLLFLFGLFAAAQAAESARPNIIVILTDDQGWADLACQGSQEDVRTPNLDALAASGVRFARGYVSAPVCVPSRAGLMTGRYQTRFNIESNEDGPLPAAEKTIAERLKLGGYVTGMVGKWHLASSRAATQVAQRTGTRDLLWGDNVPVTDENLPGRRGFDDYFCGAMQNYAASFDLGGKSLANPPVLVRESRFRVDVQTEAALAFIKRQGAMPFFLYLAYFAPHVPAEAPEKYQARFADVKDPTRRTALAMISAVDDGVGMIRQLLRERGMETRTLILFLSDNGAPTKPGMWNGSLNEPFVGEKGMLTDGGDRLPFLATWPGTLPAGKLYEPAVSSLDVMTTALGAAQIEIRPEWELDGVNLIPFLTGQRGGVPHEAHFWRFRSQAAVVSGRWKVYFIAPERWLLFDGESSAGETRNVAAQHPDVLAKLQARLRAWCAEQTPPGLPTNSRPEDDVYLRRHLAPQRAGDDSRAFLLAPLGASNTADPASLLRPTHGKAEETGMNISPFEISGNQLHVPGGEYRSGDHKARVAVAASFPVEPAEQVEVRNEALKLSGRKPEGFFSGTRLAGPTIGSVNALASFAEESLVIVKDGRTLAKGRDYLVSAPFALVGIGPQASVTTDDTVLASYSYRLQRVDTVYCAADGTAGYARGQPRIVAPEIPAVPAGTVRLANIYRPFGATRLLPEHVFTIREPSSAAPVMSGAGRILKTLEKIRSGAPVKIVTWGDSVTAGADVEQENAWAYAIRVALAEKYPAVKFSFSNISMGGTRSVQWLADGNFPGLRVRPKEECTFSRVLAEEPDLVIMEFLNDASLAPHEVSPAYERIRNAFQQIGAEWIIITPGFLVPHSYDLSVMRAPDDRPYIRITREFAGKNGLALADAAARWEHLWKEGIPWFVLLNNGYNHPNAAGHRLFVEEAMKCFE